MGDTTSPEAQVETDRRDGRYRVLLESAGEGILGLDLQGRATFVNATAAALIGRDAVDLVGRRMHELVHHTRVDGRPLPRDGCRVLAAMRSGVAQHVEDEVFWRADGTSFAVSYVSTPLVRDGAVEGAVVVFRDVTERRRLEERLRRREAEHRALAEKHLALRRVATAVAADTDGQEVLDLVAREIAALLGVEAALVARFHGSVARPIGWWGARPPRLDVAMPLSGSGALARVRRAGRPARVDDYGRLGDDPIRRMAEAGDYRASVAAPVTVRGRLWGAVLATTTRPERFAPDAEERLAEFAELVGMSVANAATHAELRTQATTDSLTGLANHRAFHERLEAEVMRARRYGRDVTLVLLDIDRFKSVNDRGGHQTGDGVLAEVARCLLAVRRGGEVLGRVGGDEFAWLLPETGGEDGERAGERARLAVAASPLAISLGLTISVGVCALSDARSAAELYRRADTALYWSKGDGRDRVCRYTDERAIGAGPAAGQPSDDALTQTRTPAGLRALAAAVDAKDPTTQRHSERVAALAVHLARELGWPQERLELMRDAGLVHDVGKIGVPDAILCKRGPLSTEEYRLVTAHAALGARIVRGVLTAEQVAWVRGHHERYDGSGYPDSLSGTAITEGARILALADAFDAMTFGRPYKRSLGIDEAVAEARSLAGTQFCARAVAALVRIGERTDLGSLLPRPRAGSAPRAPGDEGLD